MNELLTGKDRSEESPPPVPSAQMYFVVPHGQNKNYISRPSVDQKLQSLLEVYPEKEAQVRIAMFGLEGSGYVSWTPTVG